MAIFKLRSIMEVARDVTIERYVDANLDFESCVVTDPNTGDSIKLRWFLEHVQEDYMKMLEAHQRYLFDGEQPGDEIWMVEGKDNK